MIVPSAPPAGAPGAPLKDPPSVAELACVLVAVLLCGVAFVAEQTMKKGSEGKGGKSRAFAAVGFMACSGCLLLVNKLAVYHVQMPTTIVFLQLAFTAVTIGGLGQAGSLEVQFVSKDTLMKFAPVALCFLMTVCFSTKILQYANVEAMIVVRASALIPVCFLDFLVFGKRQSWRSIGVLVVLIMTCICHAVFESKNALQLQASLWIVAWYGIFCFDQIYIKHMITSVKLPIWSNAFYTNALSSVLVLPLVLFECRATSIDSSGVDVGSRSMLIVLGSCFLGLAMSYFSFAARGAFSATYFTLLGNVCKLLTIVLNNLVWEHHATLGGTVACIAAVGSAYFYQDAPPPKPPAQDTKNAGELEQGASLITKKQPFNV